MERLIPILTEDQRAAVIAAARSQLKACKGGPVPFRHQGRSLRGRDCIGLLAYAFGSFFAIADRTDYGRLPADRKLAQTLAEHFGPPIWTRPVKMENLRPGDVVTMDWGAEEAHVALVVDHPHGVGLVHSYASAKRVIEHRIDALVLSRISAVYSP